MWRPPPFWEICTRISDPFKERSVITRFVACAEPRPADPGPRARRPAQTTHTPAVRHRGGVVAHRDPLHARSPPLAGGPSGPGGRRGPGGRGGRGAPLRHPGKEGRQGLAGLRATTASSSVACAPCVTGLPGRGDHRRVPVRIHGPRPLRAAGPGGRGAQRRDAGATGGHRGQPGAGRRRHRGALGDDGRTGAAIRDALDDDCTATSPSSRTRRSTRRRTTAPSATPPTAPPLRGPAQPPDGPGQRARGHARARSTSKRAPTSSW